MMRVSLDDQAMSRDDLVARLRARLQAREWTRVHLFLLVALSAAVAFLCSVLLLALRLHSMAWRYGLAALAGYAAFLVLVRGWVFWKRRQFVGDVTTDLMDLPLPDVTLPRGTSADIPSTAFGGGRSGGAGASAPWASAQSATATPSSHAASGITLDFDADDLFWLILAAAAACAGLVAVAYVIYIAPTLVAEAAVNAAVAGHVYRGLRRREPEHWTRDMLRHTAVPAAVLVISVSVAGYALQRVAPEARSIGGVWHHLRG